MDDYTQRRVGIIGAGPAGMMAGIYAALNGASVTVFEKNDRVGKKLAITGKGRCNVTNDCDNQEFLKNVISNPKFLYASINSASICGHFGAQDGFLKFEEIEKKLKSASDYKVETLCV